MEASSTNEKNKLNHAIFYIKSKSYYLLKYLASTCSCKSPQGVELVDFLFLFRYYVSEFLLLSSLDLESLAGGRL